MEKAAVTTALDRILGDPVSLSGAEDAFSLCQWLRDSSDLPCRERMARTSALRDLANARFRDGGADAPAWLDLYRRLLLLDARDDFDCFMLYVEWDRDPSKKFYAPRRSVLKGAVVDSLQDLADRKIDFLGVSMPPRTGKSTLCIFYLVWRMGRNPSSANLMSGHSDKLTKGFYSEVLSIVGDPGTYRFADVFPGVEVTSKSSEDESIDMGGNRRHRRRFPTLTCRSVTGTLTGAVEVGSEGLLYCDDLVEDLEEALNFNRLETKFQAYLNQLVDRKKDGAQELMIGTRWSVRDPLGRIRAMYADDPRYRFVVVPALDARGESNFDYGFGLGFSTRYYRDMRDRLDKADWEAKYQGEPYEREGLLYPEDELRRYFELPEGEPDGIIAACDTKDRGADYAAMPVARIYGDSYYVDAAVCDDALPDVVEPRVASLLVSEGVRFARFESNSAGGRVAKDVQKAVKAAGGLCKIETKYTTANKETRIIMSSPWVKERCLFKDESLYSKDSDYGRFMRMLTTYTLKGRNPHDDAPDAMAMLEDYAKEFRTPRVEAVRRPW